MCEKKCKIPSFWNDLGLHVYHRCQKDLLHEKSINAAIRMSLIIFYLVHWGQLWGQWTHLSAWFALTPRSKIYKKKWFRETKISVLDWSATGSDANSVENLWRILKKRLSEELKWAITEVRASTTLETFWFVIRTNERNSKFKMCYNKV